MSKPIIVAGGGLAGLTLGIGLRQRRVPVTVFEAGRYPRHRVCGEFISGRGQAVLERLGLRQKLIQAGARLAHTAAFFSEHTGGPILPLPEPALCWPRYRLDEFLAREFQRCGGDLREQERWSGIASAPGTVHASGRRIHTGAGGWRYFGLKAHARNVRLMADLEMHLTPEGYVGLCRLSEDEVNVCGLFRSRATVPGLAAQWRDWLVGKEPSPRHERLKAAVFVGDSFCAVAGLSLAPARANATDGLCIGDALTMIPPVTGNGMSMAFESAEWAIEPLTAYSEGEIGWEEARQRVVEHCDRGFAGRLAWAAWLQKALFQPIPRTALVMILSRWDWLWRFLFARTR